MSEVRNHIVIPCYVVASRMVTRDGPVGLQLHTCHSQKEVAEKEVRRQKTVYDRTTRVFPAMLTVDWEDVWSG